MSWPGLVVSHIVWWPGILTLSGNFASLNPVSQFRQATLSRFMTTLCHTRASRLHIETRSRPLPRGETPSNEEWKWEKVGHMKDPIYGRATARITRMLSWVVPTYLPRWVTWHYSGMPLFAWLVYLFTSLGKMGISPWSYHAKCSVSKYLRL